MKLNHQWWVRLIQWALAGLWLFVAAFLTWMVVTALMAGNLGICIFFLLVSGIWLGAVPASIRELSEITLTESGIKRKGLFKSKFIPWQDIQQAGVLWQSYNKGHWNDFVLLRKGGSPRKFRDKTFLMRNEFYLRHDLIHLPYKPEVLDFVKKYYGLLDFDLANGKPEEYSVVEENDIFLE